MNPQPISECTRPSPKLTGWTATITDGDSGIGWAVVYAFAKKGTKMTIAYYDENRDAQETAGHIRELGGDCLLLGAI